MRRWGAPRSLTSLCSGCSVRSLTLLTDVITCALQHDDATGFEWMHSVADHACYNHLAIRTGLTPICGRRPALGPGPHLRRASRGVLRQPSAGGRTTPLLPAEATARTGPPHTMLLSVLGIMPGTTVDCGCFRTRVNICREDHNVHLVVVGALEILPGVTEGCGSLLGFPYSHRPLSRGP